MSDQKKIERSAELRWVRIADMRVSAMAQRELNTARVDKIAADLDPEQLGAPTVSERDSHFYIIDGQHRVEALRAIGWGDQQVQCWTYTGLTEEQEAQRFLKLNDVAAVPGFAKFRIGVTAGLDDQVEIDRIVRSVGLRISADKKDGAIYAVGSLQRVYRDGGSICLARTLRIVRDAYGDAGLQAAVISGIGLVCARYDVLLDDDKTVAALSRARGGVGGLISKAELIRRSIGGAKYHAVGAAVVEILNQGRGGKKLPPWFRNNDSGKLSVVA